MTKNSVICRLPIIGSIGSELTDGLVNIAEQCFKLTDIARILIGQNFCDDLPAIRVNCQMQFTPFPPTLRMGKTLRKILTRV